jgi:predicted small metal-binding protein
MSRKVVDCRDYPSDTHCTLTLSGEEEEVLKAATEHAVSVHGHENNEELRSEIKKMLKDEKSQPSQTQANRVA